MGGLSYTLPKGILCAPRCISYAYFHAYAPTRTNGLMHQCAQLCFIWKTATTAKILFPLRDLRIFSAVFALPQALERVVLYDNRSKHQINLQPWMRLLHPKRRRRCLISGRSTKSTGLPLFLCGILLSWYPLFVVRLLQFCFVCFEQYVRLE